MRALLRLAENWNAPSQSGLSFPTVLGETSELSMRSLSIPWQVRLHLNPHERVTPLPHSTFDPGGAVEIPYIVFPPIHSLT